MYDSCAEPGDRVAVDEPIAQIETDKVIFETNFLITFPFLSADMHFH